MPNSIQYQGLKHFPQGNAVLQKDGQWLHIYGLEHVCDGLAIDTNDATAWGMNLDPVTITGSSVLGATFVQKDNFNRLRTVAQWAVMPSPDRNYTYLLINSKLEGNMIDLMARTGDERPYSKMIYNKVTPQSDWIIAATFHVQNAPLELSDIAYRSRYITGDAGSV